MNNRINNLILDLYNEAQTESVHDFSNSVMKTLKKIVQFDSAGSVLFSINKKSQVVITGQAAFNVNPLKSAIRAECIGAESYSIEGGLSTRDPLLRKSVANSNQAHAICLNEVNDKSLREYGRRSESLNALCYVTRSNESSIKTISFWRAKVDSVFSDGDIFFSNLLIPHALQSMSINRKLAVSSLIGSSQQSGFLMAEGQNGLIHHLDDYSIFLLRQEYPDWLSSYLPNEILLSFQSGSTQRYVGNHIIVNLRRQGSLMMIGLQAKGSGAKLSPAELRVVEKIVKHGTYKEAARQLKVSPSTIRNQLHAIYKKLGVSSKSELVKVLEP